MTPLSDVSGYDSCAENNENKMRSAQESSSSSKANKQNVTKEFTKENQSELKTPKKKERKTSKQEEIKEGPPVSEITSEREGSLHQAIISKKFSLRFVQLNSWTLSYQINSLVVFDVMNLRYLLASQPGGTYAILMTSSLNKREMSGEQVGECTSNLGKFLKCFYDSKKKKKITSFFSSDFERVFA